MNNSGDNSGDIACVQYGTLYTLNEYQYDYLEDFGCGPFYMGNGYTIDRAIEKWEHDDPLALGAQLCIGERNELSCCLFCRALAVFS